MYRVVIILLLTVCSFVTAEAQTFLERLQRPQKGQGVVTVHQDAAISALVNGPKVVTAASKAPSAAATQRNATPATKPSAPETGKQVKKPVTQEDNRKTEAEAGKNADAAAAKPSSAAPDRTAAADADVMAAQKKVMRNSYKVMGFRVQAFAGGNSRQDKIKAEQIGEKIKAAIPGEPVYVHFYSPRWICRVGNYRTYEEAHQMLQAIRKLGYTQASIVKGKISVQY
ncbi:MAG: SPOR domain-containing protein [Prevotella sp.]|nr:SPOR domain-containing protein [Prevotella sp.]MDE6355589.1 SPOR domain-containing protein [Prevotella sp.]